MPPVLDAQETADRADGVVHLDTQAAAVGLDLTVASVARLTGPGSLDFGGSEFEAAPASEIEPALRSGDDDYGWWELDAGSYRVRFNEAPDPGDGAWGRVFPLERLLAAGAFHPAFVVDGRRDPLETLLVVGPSGCRLKENCRISRLVVESVENGVAS